MICEVANVFAAELLSLQQLIQVRLHQFLDNVSMTTYMSVGIEEKNMETDPGYGASVFSGKYNHFDGRAIKNSYMSLKLS